MRRGEREARKFIAAELRGETTPKPFWWLAERTDARLVELGKRKSELFPYLENYERLLPETWTTRWLTSGTGTDRMLFAVRRDWTPGADRSQSLLMPGALRHVAAGEF